ncbi:putative aryl-alcohol dehydrogenase [Gordonia paraffinivorans NBRC 108238]|uniref:Aryl-alcohol dehydrogenase n=1 Tax=Gordonia paraffinivorans NBRC 108238 TaxID=1223543 RepID=A0ABQ0IM83_9ACTN|nr:NAD(P)-dependent alcohol dehydrogenase [Gordonia paraffinivorans]GAC84610.1 putative aryl-alcohol dehydrogenase [Gordonia paraffinivorans NBRC 108238]
MTIDITAACILEPGGPFTLREVQLAEPGPGEVLIEIRGMGLCHTDIAARFGLPAPMVLGHEGSGVVAAVGPEVSRVAVGDHVAVSFASCGECAQCRRDQPAYCVRFAELNYGGGLRADGTTPIQADGQNVASAFFGQSSFASHALAAERNVVKVDPSVPFEVVGPLGCGLQTGAGAVMNSLDCRPGESILITGAGPVGLAAVMAAKERGLTTIIVSDLDAQRRGLAEELGATATIDPTAGGLAEQVRGIIPDGVDYAFDNTGVPQVLQDAVGAIAPLGTLGFVGVPQDMAATFELPIVPAMVTGLTVRGITEGDSDPATFIPYLIELYRAGKFPVDRLISSFPFEEIEQAVKAQAAGEAVKVVLVRS